MVERVKRGFWKKKKMASPQALMPVPPYPNAILSKRSPSTKKKCATL